MVASRKKSRCGAPRKYDGDSVRNVVTNVPSYRRSNFRSLAAATGIPNTSLWNLLQANKLCRRTSRVKPMLSVKQKSDRFKFVQKFVRVGHGRYRVWHDVLDYVHLNEKWFYITQINHRDYLWHDEPIPQRKVQSKRHITKVMFLCAVARPRFDFGRRVMWDGKIGLWPIVETKVAARRSKNRDRGTPVTVPMTVTKPIYRRLLVDKVIPAIQAKWPGQRGGTIYLQQNNARPHVAVDDAEVVAASRKNGWNIQLVAQPAMSPNFNVLDLGFFNAIQSLQHQTAMRTIDDLIASVQDAYSSLASQVWDKTFMTLQKVMEEAFKLEGDNIYKLPHLKKDLQLKSGTVALRPPCDEDVTLELDALESRLDDEHLVGEIVGMLGPALNIVDDA
ncbi:hypothetical protein H257_07636 [Aphanomyces astaci]|uniref:Tc1-like transposase DDE domain-containing protein n=1 Tax=Aphanomyces astaci TaxID=112090 RepID=W4GGI5_APHAT|nr:hypothetical protein H257_07636 [Aphanomyces astaci]ETV78807.1 hypothetical protein H257_07636 [Aphanomyces astaci]|eukprot:XP_009831526.1 hypothetical protein H257_07636 [Aphanomyces astaci]